MAKKQRSIVGYPLTPEILAELDALGPLSAATPFMPTDNWSNVYQIWSCHGYRESGNEVRGHLRIQRRAGTSDDAFQLQVHQEVRNDGGEANTLKADITCQADSLATPVKWRISSTFQNAQGRAVPELSTTQTGKAGGNAFTIETNGKTRRGQSTKTLTGDWCLLEAVQRMPLNAQACRHLDVLEEMCLLQSDHRIAYLRLETPVIRGVPWPLHRFQQWGRGMLPYDYWLDKHHRLQIFTTLSLAYVLDSNLSAGAHA